VFALKTFVLKGNIQKNNLKNIYDVEWFFLMGFSLTVSGICKYSFTNEGLSIAEFTLYIYFIFYSSSYKILGQ